MGGNMNLTIRHEGELIHSTNPTRENIGQLAQSMIELISKGEMQEQDCPVTHRFADGCYLREIFMPKDTLIVGKIHATRHFNIILEGEVTIATVDGVEHKKAPCTFISEAGIQKVVYMHSDCVWQTVHVTSETDLKEIEKQVIVESYDELLVQDLIKRVSQ